MKVKEIISYSKVKSNKYPFSSWLKTPIIKHYEHSGFWILEQIQKQVKNSPNSQFKILDVGGSTPAINNYCKEQGIEYNFINNAPQHYNMTWGSNYDIVVCSHFIEHLYIDAFLKYIKSIKKVMRSGGTLYIATPNGYYFNTKKYDHVLVWDIGSLYAILCAIGFDTKMYRLNRTRKNLIARLIKLIRTPFTYFFEIDFNCEEITAICKIQKEMI